MAAEPGIVIDLVSSNVAKVRTTPATACEGCASQGSCSEQPKEMEVEVVNDAGAVVGDRVLLTFDTSSLLKATFLLYIFPIIWLIVGAILGQWLAGRMDADPSVVSVIAGLLCFAGAVLFVKRKGNLMGSKEEYTPRITRVLRPQSVQGVSRNELPNACPDSVTGRSIPDRNNNP